MIFGHSRGVPTDLLDVKIFRLSDSDSFHTPVKEVKFFLKVLIFRHSRGFQLTGGVDFSLLTGAPNDWKC